MKGLEESELNRLDKGLLNRFAVNCKSDPDRHSHPLVENTETTVTRLLLQIESLLADFKRPQDISSRSLALQGLALLGQDLLDFVRENIACPVEINTASRRGAGSLEVIS